MTNQSFGEGLFVLDASHLPSGCSLWPAWRFSYSMDNWGKGEMDVVEGQNLFDGNQLTLHDQIPGCVQPPSACSNQKMSGTFQPSVECTPGVECTSQAICEIPESDFDYWSCPILQTGASNFGKPVNQDGGAVYAMQRTATAIKVWFFSRSAVPPELAVNSTGLGPQSITDGQIARWGLPLAYYDLSEKWCDGAQLPDLRMILEINQCGPFAGSGDAPGGGTYTAAWSPSSNGLDTRPDCSKLTGYPLCEDFANSPVDSDVWFPDAYWKIASLRHYTFTAPPAPPNIPPMKPPSPEMPPSPPLPPWSPVPGRTVPCNGTEIWAFANISTEWIDFDSPAEACTTTSDLNNQPHVLVFSDEFEIEDRSFGDGNDTRWTSLDLMATGNQQVNYYNSSNTGTSGGRLQIKTSTDPATYPTGSYPPLPTTGTAPLQTGMLQTWNKFCFTGGIVEMSAKMPGKSSQAGLWPAFWLFGNLGRALYQSSTDGIWPFIFNETVETSSADFSINQCDAQRISASNPAPGYGLFPYHGRGAPEIDIVEVMPGANYYYYDESWACTYNCTDTQPDARTRLAGSYSNPIVSTSLQSAPGLPKNADQRPNQGCLPSEMNVSGFYSQQWYPELSINHYGSAQPSEELTVVPNYNFWGSYYDQIPSNSGDAFTTLHTDAYSANTQLDEGNWDSFHTYRVEWYPHPKAGYIQWTLDGNVQFQIDADFLGTPRDVSFGGTPAGKLQARMMPDEPMYLLLNVDASPKWGWPTPTPSAKQQECTEEGLEARHDPLQCPSTGPSPPMYDCTEFNWYDDLCNMLPTAVYEIDWVRVYQPAYDPEHYSLGCDPPTKPTRRWIAGHANDYKMPPPIANLTLAKVAQGGGVCTTDADCNPTSGGVCVSPLSSADLLLPHASNARVCKCGTLMWTGPHCRSQAGPAESHCMSVDQAEPPLPTCAPPASFDVSELNQLMFAICSDASAFGSATSQFCEDVLGFANWLSDCEPLWNATDYTAWTSCVEVLTDCSAFSRAARLLNATFSDGEAAGSFSHCCNTYYTNSSGAPVYTCSAVGGAAGIGVGGLSTWPSLDPAVRGVLYAPFLPGATSSTDLYRDEYYMTYYRDATVLHDLGATTLLLEPSDPSLFGAGISYRQALYNATNFEPADESALPLMLWYDWYRERQHWPKLQLVPNLDMAPSTVATALSIPDATVLGQAPNEALASDAIDSAVAYVCGLVQAFVSDALTPAPNTTQLPSGVVFGGGGGSSSKANTQALLLNFLPNDGSRWSDNGGLGAWLDVVASPDWNLFTIVDSAAQCAQDQQVELLQSGVLQSKVPVLVSLSDNDCTSQCGPALLACGPPLSEASSLCVSAAGWVGLYRQWKLNVSATAATAAAPPVDGFVVTAARTRGCDAAAMVSNVVEQVNAFRSALGTLPLIWFSVGVDAYDSLSTATYPPASFAEPPFLLPGSRGYATDARTQCLVSLIDSINAGCETSYGLLCGIVVQEYADSYWRAIAGDAPSELVMAGTSTAAWASCIETAAGSSQRVEAAASAQLPCGTYQPCAGACVAQNVSAATSRRRLQSSVEPMEGVPRVPLPQRLLCDPFAPPDQSVSWTSLPPCADASSLIVDAWYNPAYDGLMAAAPAELQAAYCGVSHTESNETLIPRTAYFVLRDLWASAGPVAATGEGITIEEGVATTNATSVPWEWPGYVSRVNADVEAEASVLEDPAWLILWLFVLALLLALSRACCLTLLGEDQRLVGRLATLLSVAVLVALTALAPAILQLPAQLDFLIKDMAFVLVFLIIWCPMNGGGGSGNWWWVHLAGIGMVLTMHAGAAEYSYSSIVTYSITYCLGIFNALMAGLGSSSVDPPTTPFWDPCASAQCCVMSAADAQSAWYYFPWSASITVPQWWAPYIPWATFFEMFALAGVLSIVGIAVSFVVLQLLYAPKLLYDMYARLRGQRARNAATAPSEEQPGLASVASNSNLGDASAEVARPGGVADASDLEVDDIDRAIDDAHKKLCADFGDHFQSAALEASLAQLKGFIYSRARRMQGFESHSTMDSADSEDFLQVLAKGLEPPSKMPATQAGEVWEGVVRNLQRWLDQIEFRHYGRTTTVMSKATFAPIIKMLQRRGPLLEGVLSDLADRSRGPAGPDTDHWYIALLYLAMGADNFFRASPEVINLLFVAHWAYEPPPPEDEQLGSAANGFPSGSAANGSPSGSLERPQEALLPASNGRAQTQKKYWARTADLHDLRNLRCALYELHRFAGGKVGGRIPDFFREKYLNYDDLGELCTPESGRSLFAGLEALVIKLEGETEELIGASHKLVLEHLLYEESGIARALKALCKAADEYKRSLVVRKPANRDVERNFKRDSLSSNPVRESLRAARDRFPSVDGVQMAALPRASISRSPSLLAEDEPNRFASGSAQHLGRPAPRSILDQQTTLSVYYLELEKQLCDKGLGCILSEASNLRNVPNIELARASLLIRRVTELINRARESQALFNDLVDRFLPVQAELGTRPELVKLAKINTDCHAALGSLIGESSAIFIESVVPPKRFTWGVDEHKTFEERPGYSTLLLSTWFLWKTVALMLVMMLTYLTGGYYVVAFIVSIGSPSAPDQLAGLSEALASLHPFGDAFYAWLETVCEGYVPFFVAGYLSFGIARLFLAVIEDLMWISRAISVDSTREHRTWTVSARLAAVVKWTFASGSKVSAMQEPGPEPIASADTEGADSSQGRWGSLVRIRATLATLSLSRVLRSLSIDEEDGFARRRSDTEKDVAELFSHFSEGAPRRSARCLLTSCTELVRLFCLPLSLILRGCAAVAISLVTSAMSLSALFFDPVFSPHARLATLSLRVTWLAWLVVSFCQGAETLFVFLILIQAWLDVLVSAGSSFFAHVEPSSLTQALFGWYYAWWEAPWKRLMPRDIRSVKSYVLSSLFWVGVFFFKAIIEAPAVQALGYEMHTLSAQLNALVANGAGWLEVVSVAVVLVLRIAFSLLFFVADLHLFVVVVIAISGSLTLAKGIWRGKWSLVAFNLRTLWDRMGDIAQHKLLEARASVLYRFPLAIEQVGQQNTASTCFATLWNRGLLRDLVASHLIDDERAGELFIYADKQHGELILPDLSKFIPVLCFEARRRIQSFLAYCSRTDTPVPALPSHSPSLTVLVPVYGETVVRSWVDMFAEQHVGSGVTTGHSTSLTNFEYMVERHMEEFGCLLRGLTDAERQVLEPHLEGSPTHPTALASASDIRDALWFSDYLLLKIQLGAAVTARSIAALPSEEMSAEISEAFDISQLMLGCARAERSSTGGNWSVPGPSAPAGACAEVLRDLQERRVPLAEEAASLGLVSVIAVVERLYGMSTEERGAAWETLRGALAADLWATEAQSPTTAEAQSAQSNVERGQTVERALTVLGVERAGGWQPNEVSEELWRTLNEARVKHKLRLWFSCREQTVWRTLSGLCKAGPALRLMQEIGSSAIGEACKKREASIPRGGSTAKSEVPPSLYTVMAALQNYGGWREGKAKLTKQAKKLKQDWSGSSDAAAAKLRGMLLGSNQLANLLDQCLSVSYLLHEYPGIQVVYLPKEPRHRPDGQVAPGECVFKSVLFQGRRVMISSNASILSRPGTSRSSASVPSVGVLLRKPLVAGTELTVGPVGDFTSFERVRAIELPGNPIVDALAEGKPINQANALLHVTSEIIMVNDMNQGADLEQWFFLPQLLAEFHTDGKGRHDQDSRRVIVGFKENIFTERDGLVGRSGALNEFTFGTIVQRELHLTLGARLHYGHPDLFNFQFALVNGGTSKCSKTINVSEDIFGGINALVRGGSISYVDYMHVDKGRDVQYDAALGFEGKIAGGTAMHTLSRDFLQLMSSPFCWCHKASLFSGAFGFFWSNMMLAMSIMTLAAMHGVAALLPPDVQFLFYSATPSYIPLVNLGFVYLLALAVQYMYERGILPTIEAILTVIAAIPLTLSKLKTHQYYAHRGLALGLAKYVPTGRDLATRRYGFRNHFERYAMSHFGPALDVILLLLVTWRFSALGSSFYVQATLSLWLSAFSWLFAPALNNPFAFTLSGLYQDRQEWAAWLYSEGFEDWFYGQKSGATLGELNQNNWYSWLNAEPFQLRLGHAVAKLAIYGTITLLMLQQLIYVPAISIYQFGSGIAIQWQVLGVLLVLLFLCYGARVEPGLLSAYLFYIGLVLLLLPLFIQADSIFDGVHAAVLVLYSFGKLLLALLELLLLAYASIPLWSDSARVASVVSSERSSRGNLLLPRSVGLLSAWSLPLSVARVHAELLGTLFLLVSAFITLVLSLPLSAVGAMLVFVFLTALATEQTSAAPTVFLVTVCSFLLVFALWMMLSGHAPRKRTRAAYSVSRFQFLTLRLNALHNWLLMNRAVARNLAERAAAD